jgi:hypothetical protein
MNEPALIRTKKRANANTCVEDIEASSESAQNVRISRLPTLPYVKPQENLDDLPVSDAMRMTTKLDMQDLTRIALMARTMASPAVIARAIGLKEADLYSEENITAFQAVFTRARAVGQIGLQKTQYDVAMRGNVAMLIHLGEVYIDQSKEITINHNVVDPSQMSIDDLYKKLAEVHNVSNPDTQSN